MIRRIVFSMSLMGLLAASGLAGTTGDVQKPNQPEGTKNALATVEEEAPVALEELVDLEVTRSEGKARESVPALLGGDSAGLETLGWFPRPCWCCPFCCCMT